MDIKELRRANGFRNAVLRDETVRAAFLDNPVEQLSKGAGIVLTTRQATAVKRYIEAATAFNAERPPSSPPPPPGIAPKWVHDIVDWIWDHWLN